MLDELFGGRSVTVARPERPEALLVDETMPSSLC